jgi:hypothetical protein
MTYGDGAVMGVPAHDERDFAFAKKYGIAIKQVVAVEGESFTTDAWADWYGDKQKCVTVNSGKYDGLSYKAAVDAVAADLAAKGVGEKKPPGVCATGAFRVNVTGARRFLSFIANAAVMYLCLTKICRWYCQPNVFLMVPVIR